MGRPPQKEALSELRRWNNNLFVGVALTDKV